MKRIIMLLLGLLITVQLNAQWQRTFGPFGYEVTVFAAGNGMVIANGNEVSLSTNNGLSWEKRSNGIWPMFCTAAIISNSRLIVGMGEGNNVGYLFISDDNGANWEQVTIPNNTQEIQAFAKLGSNLYFCSYDNGIFKSTNNGTSWTRIASGTPVYRGSCMEVMGSTLFLGTQADGVLKSTDEGVTWQSIGNPQSLTMVSSLAVKNSSLFVTYSGWSYENAAYRTDNLGGTWVDIGQGLQPFFRSISSDGSNVYIATDKGLFKSLNNGASWTQIFFANTWTQKSIVYNGNIILGTREVGIFTSSNGGTSWLNSGNIKTYVKAVCTYGNSVLTGSDGQTGITISRDNGNTFTEFKPLVSYTNCFAVRGADIFAGTTPYIPQEGGVFKSTDIGVTWNRIGLADKDVQCLVTRGNYLFVGTVYNGIFRTSNDGATWAQVNNGVTQTYIESLAAVDTVLYAGTNSGVLVSTNNGANWNSAGLSGVWVNSLAVIGSQLFAGTGMGVYKMDTLGTWNQIGFYPTEIYSLKALDTKLFAVTGSAIYATTNYGADWILKSQGLPVSSGCFDITFSGTYAFASMGSGEGLYRRPLSEVIGIQNISSELPSAFSLYQNYPNPFNPETKIRFDVGRNTGVVTLKVYNMLGEEVLVLVNETLQTGTYEAAFSGKGLPSGVYIYRLSAGDYVQSRRMTLIK